MAKKAIKHNEKFEREYIIPLRARHQHVPKNKKTPKAIKTVKEFLAKHMQIRDKDLNKIKLDKFVNEYLWARGIKKPPYKVKVKAIKENGIVKVELVDYPTKLKFKKAREGKFEKESEAKAEKKKSLMQKVKEKKETKSDDENKDGVEDKKEIKEKQKSVAEAGQEMERAMVKQMKQSKGGKTKEPKHQFRQALQK